MEVRETRTVTQTKSIRTGYRCDICNKLYTVFEDDLYDIGAEHDDWGRDSVESVKEKDICNTADCYIKAIQEFLVSFKDHSETAIIDGKPYSMVQQIVERLGSK